ncbi:OLC1v1030530C1 [Oldenlandia corymbosa var. corymbosa]|uniref:OLC1v1030530C1 n=1 Tax=Oldenlandia corymbosa var. corymbosa TaxID=529605 RepID=A0AAV1CHW5_OLDCO|nr:OLC1v1030530C1 [Oldenlandia corymbosa var. corymbosa]
MTVDQAGEVPTGSPHTFASFFQKPLDAPLSKGSLIIKEVRLINGSPVLEYKDDEYDQLVAPHQLSLIGKFSYGRPKMDDIHKEFKKLGFHGGYTLGLMNPRHVLIQFEKEEDYQRCWIRTFWNIAGFSLRILKWRQGFRFEEDLPIVPIWVSLFDLPIEFLNPEVIFSMATAMGKPLKVYSLTLNMTRSSVARFCVEVDLTKELPKSVKEDCRAGIPKSVEKKNKFPSQKTHARSKEIPAANGVDVKPQGGTSRSNPPSQVAQSNQKSQGATVNLKSQGSMVNTKSKPVENPKSAIGLSHAAAAAATFAHEKEAAPENPNMTGANRFSVLASIMEIDEEISSDDENVEIVYVKESPVKAMEDLNRALVLVNYVKRMLTDDNSIGLRSTEVEDAANDDEVLHFQVKHVSAATSYFLSAVYAMSTQTDCGALWETLVSFRQNHPASAWIIGGDFNVIRSLEEYSGTLVQDYNAIEDYNECIESCGLLEAHTIGEDYTWGGMRQMGWVSKKLDRVLFSEEWEDLFLNTSIENLNRTSSDYCPMLLTFALQGDSKPRLFRFQNMWLRRSNFFHVVQENWEQPVDSFAIPPPKTVTQGLEKRCQKFLWEGANDERRRHWRPWSRITFPVCENGLGLRSFHDVIEALMAKLWWKVKNKKGIWSSFLLSLSATAKEKTSWSRIIKIDAKVVPLSHDLKVSNEVEGVFIPTYFGLYLSRLPRRKSRIVKWMRPGPNSFVLNCDGSSNLDGAGHSFVIRGEEGVFVYGECGYLGDVDSFTFEEMWTRRDAFLDMVKDNWEQPVSKSGMLGFSIKLRRLKVRLKEWNKADFEDVLQNLKDMEEAVQDKELEFDQSGADSARNLEEHKEIEVLFKVKVLRPKRKTRKVLKWHSPEPGQVVLNMDGSALGQPGRAGWGYIVRGERGSIMFAECRYMGVATSYEAGLAGIYHGLSEYGLNRNGAKSQVPTINHMDTVIKMYARGLL